jgi:hypothetical protein
MIGQRTGNGVKVLVGNYPDRNTGFDLARDDRGIWITSLAPRPDLDEDETDF